MATMSDATQEEPITSRWDDRHAAGPGEPERLRVID